MTITYQAQDSDEFAHDTDFEQFGNLYNYYVSDGCAITEDAANLTIDFAAGNIVHNGALVAVAAQVNGLTLVADASNERWSYATLDSGGSAVLVSGDAAADSSTEPTKPELGDRVAVKFYKIEAAQTIAASISVALDKRVLGPTDMIITSSGGHMGVLNQTNNGVVGAGSAHPTNSAADGTVSVADNETFTFTIDNGAIFIVCDANAAKSGVFHASRASATITELADPSTAFDVTDVDNGRIAVFKGSTSGVVSVKNYTNGTIGMSVVVLGYVASATAPS